MKQQSSIEQFAPLWQADSFTEDEQWRLQPFFTNLTKSVYVPMIFSPEIIGALCSRTSRAADDLRLIFLREYMDPFLNQERQDNETEEQQQERQRYGNDLQKFLEFLHEHPIERMFSNPRARSFYNKWLAQYGDDSIAQMAGTHLVYSGLSQLAIKHYEDQRIGLAPIEKSTRYVNYAIKVKDQYRYYTDPKLAQLGLESQYRQAMDGLFATYVDLLPKLSTSLQEQFPAEKPSVVEKKAFDTLRGLLPVATLSQVAFFGNGQAFEYMVSRSMQHPLGEVRWAGEEAYRELSKVAPSFLRRIKAEDNQAAVTSYQEYLAQKPERMAPAAEKYVLANLPGPVDSSGPRVELVEHDPDGEAKVITGILFAAANNHRSWQETLQAVQQMDEAAKREVLDMYLKDRTQRWQKVGRAFENVFVRFDLTMNIGAWRDLHRHRMLTQQRQYFTTEHGYDLPPEVVEAGLADAYQSAVAGAEAVHQAIAQHDPALAQYAVTLAHRMRFMQWANLRECFWELELRTIPEGHPDYRRIEQEKFKLLEKVYPLICSYMRVNLADYDFARRGQEEKIQAKLRQLDALKVA